jgi:hypothetical protein
VEEQAKLVGGCLGTGGAVSGEMTLPGLDMIFGNAAPAIDTLVKCFRPAAGEIGDDEAGVGSGLAGFNACNVAFDAAQALCAVVELLKAPQLGCLPEFITKYTYQRELSQLDDAISKFGETEDDIYSKYGRPASLLPLIPPIVGTIVGVSQIYEFVSAWREDRR